MEYNLKNFNEELFEYRFSSYVLGVDIGGTNTNLCIAGIKESKPVLLYSLNYQSQGLDSIIPTFNDILKYSKEKYEIDVSSACIGAAGVVSPDKKSAKLTNINWDINIEEIKNHTQINDIKIINDFQAIGYGINLLDPNNPHDFLKIKPDNLQKSHATKAIIGAGTGLGKSILSFNEYFDAYLPNPSEGGHADFPPQNDEEYEMVKFIKNFRKIPHPLTYEELLSGRGIESIYEFLKNQDKYCESVYAKEIDTTYDKASLISKYKTIDNNCKNTFSLFTRFYARCAKNYVLDTLATGGLYIAGGIATKNKEIFSTEEFIEEFENAYKRSEYLKNIPISIITNYDVSLYGACYAAYLFFKKKDFLSK